MVSRLRRFHSPCYGPDSKFHGSAPHPVDEDKRIYNEETAIDQEEMAALKFRGRREEEWRHNITKPALRP